MARVHTAPVGRSFGVILALFAALLAAVLAHVAIDVAGDYLLSDDAYDHVAHQSRAIVALAGGACGLIVLLLAMWNAFEDGETGMPRRAGLAPETPALWWFVPMVAALSFVLLIGMEVDDAWAATGRLIDVDDALGGSLWLGGIAVALASLLCAATAWGFARWIGGVGAALAAAITGLFVRRRCSPQTAAARLRRLATIVSRTISPLADRCSKRGPPPAIA